MPLESATYLNDLNQSNPAGTDAESQGDDHLRLIKAAAKATFPGASRPYRFPASLATKTTSYSTDLAADLHGLIRCDATGGAITLTLTSPTFDGWWAIIQKIDSSANAIVITPTGTINGSATLSLTKQWQSALVRWNSITSLWMAMPTIATLPYYAGGQDIPWSDLAQVSTDKRVLGFTGTAPGDIAELTATQVLDFIGTPARGNLLMRGASAFGQFVPGTAGQFLQSAGAAADLVWALPLVPAFQSATYTTNTALSTIIPYDDTIPQIGEGTEILTLSITPVKASSIIRATFTGQYSCNSSNHGIAALFKNGAANAVQAVAGPTASGVEALFALEYAFSPGSTSAITLAIRVGAGGANIYMNGTTGARTLGGAAAATLIAQEIFTA